MKTPALFINPDAARVVAEAHVRQLRRTTKGAAYRLFHATAGHLRLERGWKVLVYPNNGSNPYELTEA